MGMLRNANYALSLVAAVFLVLGFLILTEGDASLGRHIVLSSSNGSEVGQVKAEIGRMRATGFSVTTDVDAVVERIRAQDSDVTIFAVTRQSMATLPEGLLRDLYARGVVVIGLDIAMRELTPYALGYEAGIGMLPYMPGQPVFSMMNSTCGGSGYMSERLGIFDVATVALSRSSEHCS